MLIPFLILFGIFAAFALTAILAEPTAALLAADAITRTARLLASVLRSHAAGRTAARAAYRAAYRETRGLSMGDVCQ